MLAPEQVEDLICLVSSLDRPALVAQFSEFDAGFPVDFTPEFLEQTDLDRLRHIFVALCLQCQHVPDLEEADAR